MVGAGTLITCSWQHLSSPMACVHVESEMGGGYSEDVETGFYHGLGILSDTVGWLGEDMFSIYINKTEKRQMETYQCVVGTVDSLLWSNMFALIVNGKNMMYYSTLPRCCLMKTCLRAVWS